MAYVSSIQNNLDSLWLTFLYSLGFPPDVGGLIILGWILERWDGVMWTGLVWLRIGTGGELL
jgi:hypothetical protein